MKLFSSCQLWNLPEKLALKILQNKGLSRREKLDSSQQDNVQPVLYLIESELVIIKEGSFLYYMGIEMVKVIDIAWCIDSNAMLLYTIPTIGWRWSSRHSVCIKKIKNCLCNTIFLEWYHFVLSPLTGNMCLDYLRFSLLIGDTILCIILLMRLCTIMHH